MKVVVRLIVAIRSIVQAKNQKTERRTIMCPDEKHPLIRAPIPRYKYGGRILITWRNIIILAAISGETKKAIQGDVMALANPLLSNSCVAGK